MYLIERAIEENGGVLPLRPVLVPGQESAETDLPPDGRAAQSGH
jgi:hypothetical protein